MGNAVAGPNDSVTLTGAVGGESGACWSVSPVTLTSGFTMSYTIGLGATGGADGIAFVLQDDTRTTSAISGNGTPCGSCLGYSGILPITPSFAFALNDYTITWGNGAVSPFEDGLATTTTTCPFFTSPGSCPYTFTSEILHSAGNALTITWAPNLLTPANSTLTYTIVDSELFPRPGL